MLGIYRATCIYKLSWHNTVMPLKYLWVILGIFIIILLLWVNINATDMKSGDTLKRIVGGPCDYHDYKGKAEVQSLEKIFDETHYNNRTIRELFKITYYVYPEETIHETFINLKRRKFILTLPDSSYPDSYFIQKNDIYPGKKLDCFIKVIKRGSCSPVIIRFPSLK
jgi:hypothetical protein